eukprot:9787804-Alexandrium_andersonii.AAC.1
MEAAANPAMHSELERILGEEGWAQVYHDHPVVKDAALKSKPRPIPIAIYADATPYTKNDGVLAITAGNLVTGR